MVDPGVGAVEVGSATHRCCFESTLNDFEVNEAARLHLQRSEVHTSLVGGFNPSEKY